MDPLTVPVPEGVSPDEFVTAIGTFIGLKCNPYRKPSPCVALRGSSFGLQSYYPLSCISQRSSRRASMPAEPFYSCMAFNIFIPPLFLSHFLVTLLQLSSDTIVALTTRLGQ